MNIVSIVNYLIFVVSTLLTYSLGIFSKKHKWNDTMPIPVQNFIVGLVVFVLAYAFCLIMKFDVEANVILGQICFAIGGSGFATLSYDAQKIGKGE